MKILTPITAAHALLVLGCLLSTVKISADELKDSLIPGTIKEILSKHCVECHSNDSREGDLNLASAEGIQQGGESGPALNTAAPLKSLLWEKITAGEMPPQDAPRLTAQELSELREWLTSNDWTPWQREQTVTQHDVLPILLLRCATCHGRQQQQGGLDIRSVASLLQGGKQGPAIIPGDPGNSLLLKRIHAEEMPPRDDLAKYSVKPMESQEIEVLERWISTGAAHVAIAEDV
ncbi:MAG: c-type cytochrome domain-containing protein, partial [Planctomycetota bacterium]|nr:c-type cytochrome domain-containing protein [Planctomycetota bacterium]